MKNGGMVKVIETSIGEKGVFSDLLRVDRWLSTLREAIRRGEAVGVGAAL